MVMTVVLVFEVDVLRLISGHAPQVVEEVLKETVFYDELKGECR